MLNVRTFSELSADELYEILRARAEVFLMEQGIVYVDADEVDRRATHVFRREERSVVSYARLFPEAEEGVVHMGRVLTTKRGKGLGREVVEEALRFSFSKLKAQCVRIDSQSSVAPFYSHLGFRQTSDVFVLEGVEHVKMELSAAAFGASGLCQSQEMPTPQQPSAPPYDDVWLHFNPRSPYPYSYKYPRASVTADCCLFAKKDEQLHVLLIRRGAPPYEGRWAFPGGFLETGHEDTEQCARRELQEETGLTANDLKLVGVFSRPGRDPRCPIVTASYCGLIPFAEATGSDDAAEARWFPVDAVPPLAFDHDEMLRMAAKLAMA